MEDSISNGVVRLDGRTVEGRFCRDLRAAIEARLGGEPDALRAALIDHAVNLGLQVRVMDDGFARTGRLPDREQYFGVSDRLRAALAQLGITAPVMVSTQAAASQEGAAA